MAEQWEVVDNDGTVHSGEETEMRLAFSVMTNSEKENDLLDDGDIADYMTDWNGDLKLIQIHSVSR